MAVRENETSKYIYKTIDGVEEFLFSTVFQAQMAELVSKVVQGSFIQSKEGWWEKLLTAH